MTEETIDPGLLEQTKSQIRKLVAEIADLAESDIQPNEFYVEFLNRSVAAVAATGGAFWMMDGRGGLRLQYQLEFGATGLMDGRVKTAPHDALLGCMLQASQAQIVPPSAVIEGVPQAFNPTEYALIISPLMVDKQVVGLLEILMDPTRRAAQQKSTLRFVSDLCDLAATYLKNRQMRQMMSQQRLWNQLEGFTHQIHGSLDLKETAYAVVNDGKRLVACDRLTVALKIGGRTMVEAVSGQEVVEQRSNLVRELTRLCKVVIRSGEDLVYTGNTDGLAPDIRDALEMYVDESGSKVVVATLLHKPEAIDTGPETKVKDKVPFGCLVAEQIGDELAPTDMHARTEVVSRHASTALFNSQEHHKIFLKPLFKALGSPWRMLRGRTLAKIGAALAVVLAVIAAMAFVPCTLTIEGHGSLLPEARQKIYAPVAGIVGEVLVDHDARVKKGDILAKLDSFELQKELKQLFLDNTKALSQMNSLEIQAQKLNSSQENQEQLQVRAQQAEARITAKYTREQIEILNDQIESMNIRSPQDGIITTWEAKKNLLGRPVEIGTELLQVAATDGDWIMEVEVPDDDMGPILAAHSKLEKEIAEGKKKVGTTLPAYFVPMTGPETLYEGYVVRIAPGAETMAESEQYKNRHIVKVTVGFSDAVRKDYLARNQIDEMRPGAEVRARVDCGRTNLAYYLLRKPIQVFYESVLFRWPFLH
ncbi:MAG TPA: biotin/lipoyl-binding protein [Isosphaeraceae bacterium]|nr:biotin/lipoyl-binding protein [Isosphaeraceae bacterium]